MGKYSDKNARAVLDKVEDRIAILEEQRAIHTERYGHPLRHYSFPMRTVYAELSIFDWWVDELSLTRLKEMRRFLKLAIYLGYTGYVCFKVGVTGCANGMWAHTKESENGYSPKDCDFLYRSFTPEYTYYDIEYADGTDLHSRAQLAYDAIKTERTLREVLREYAN